MCHQKPRPKPGVSEVERAELGRATLWSYDLPLAHLDMNDTSTTEYVTL